MRRGRSHHDQGLCHRLADQPFALAAHSWLLAEAAWHRRQLHAPAGRTRQPWPISSTALQPNGYAGCNVTIPHKESVFRLVTRADESTERLGAVNTVFLRDGKILGHQYRWRGFHQQPAAVCTRPVTCQHAAPWCSGAGGASLAVVNAILEQGAAEVVVANRTIEKAELLRKRFGSRVTPVAWDDAAAQLAECSLLVNTTSLGMKGQPELAHRSFAARRRRRGDRHRLHAAAHEAARRCGARAAIPWSRGLACCCTRRCAASRCGSASRRRSRRNFMIWSRATSIRVTRDDRCRADGLDCHGQERNGEDVRGTRHSGVRQRCRGTCALREGRWRRGSHCAHWRRRAIVDGSVDRQQALPAGAGRSGLAQEDRSAPCIRW